MSKAQELVSFMDRGVLRMPYELAMSNELSRLQFYERVQSLLDRIESAGSEQQAAQQDAETVKPEAGRYVLAWMEGREVPIRAMWVPAKWLLANDECPEDWAEYDDAKDEYFCPEGWYEKNEHEEQNWSVDTPVVAWMELPRLAARASNGGKA